MKPRVVDIGDPEAMRAALDEIEAEIRERETFLTHASAESQQLKALRTRLRRSLKTR
jgi:hypothetical protein